MSKKNWSLTFDDYTKKRFKNLDKPVQKRILSIFETKILPAEDPIHYAEALVGELIGYYRFRIGDYRLICIIEDEVLLITTVEVAHRKEAYTKIKRR